MFPKLEMVQMAQAMARHAGSRMSLVAQNIAHADTPNYQSRDIAKFADVYQSGLELRATKAGHFQDSFAPGAEPFVDRGLKAPNGNSVSLEQEMVKGAQSRQDHEMALSIYRSTSSILRSALGRSGG